jgi:hypothetical protein
MDMKRILKEGVQSLRRLDPLGLKIWVKIEIFNVLSQAG